MVIECNYCVIYLGFVYIVDIILFIGYGIKIFDMFNFREFIMFFDCVELFM